MLKPTRKLDGHGNRSIRIVRGSVDRKSVLSGYGHTSLRSVEDIRSAQLWLSDGAPIADVLTMLESRHRFELSSADSRAYAVETLWAARGLSRRDYARISKLKESLYAIA